MLARKWSLNTQRTQLANAMTFRFGNNETLETRTLAVLPLLELQASMECCVCMWCFGRAPLFLGCHIDLGRGHMFFDKLGVRTVVASKQSPHLFLPMTSFEPQGHKIPAEIQPRISSDKCAIYRAICDSSGQNKIHSWIASTSEHQALETDSTYTEFLNGRRMNRRKTPVMKFWENREGRWVRVHISPDGHYSTQCTMNSLFAIISLNVGWQEISSLHTPYSCSQLTRFSPRNCRGFLEASGTFLDIAFFQISVAFQFQGR